MVEETGALGDYPIRLVYSRDFQDALQEADANIALMRIGHPHHSRPFFFHELVPTASVWTAVTEVPAFANEFAAGTRQQRSHFGLVFRDLRQIVV